MLTRHVRGIIEQNDPFSSIEWVRFPVQKDPSCRRREISSTNSSQRTRSSYSPKRTVLTAKWPRRYVYSIWSWSQFSRLENKRWRHVTSDHIAAFNLLIIRRASEIKKISDILSVHVFSRES